MIAFSVLLPLLGGVVILEVLVLGVDDIPRALDGKMLCMMLVFFIFIFLAEIKDVAVPMTGNDFFNTSLMYILAVGPVIIGCSCVV